MSNTERATARCELCGRGMAQRALTPFWWQHKTVCDRAGCRAAARDAAETIFDSRDAWKDTITAIAHRHDSHPLPVGWRDDGMTAVDVIDNEDWWANNIIKRKLGSGVKA